MLPPGFCLKLKRRSWSSIGQGDVLRFSASDVGDLQASSQERGKNGGDSRRARLIRAGSVDPGVAEEAAVPPQLAALRRVAPPHRQPVGQQRRG